MRRKGSNNPNWKGERKRAGYVYRYFPEHPRATNFGNRYVKRADLVMEKKLGRALKVEEIVHHKDLVRDNDNQENLQAVTRAEHNRIHKYRDDLDIEKIHKRHREGVTIEKIAADFECCRTAILDRIPESERRGHPFGEKNSSWIEINIKKAKRMRSDGKTYQEIGDALGVSRNTVRRRLDKELIS